MSALAATPSLGRAAAVRTLRARLPDGLQALVVLAAAALWIGSVRAVDMHHITDLGIVPALPPDAFLALAVANASFALAMRRAGVATWLAVLHLVVIVVMLHGATSLIDSEPAFNVVWRHAGVTDYVLETGRVNPDIDAYFNWPGFFFLAGLATKAAGLESALGLSRWAPVAFELMYLPALVVIARVFSADRRIVWTAVWIFYMTNWVGQDYLSPQAMAYVLYLALIAAVLTCFSRTAAPDLARWRARGAALLVRLRMRPRNVFPCETAFPDAAGPGQRSGLILVCVVLIAAAVASHQLTPWMMLASLVGLVGLRRCTARGLPVITLVLLVAWMAYLATAYLDGHLKPLLGQTFDVEQAVAANVSGRLQGSANHLLVVRLRLVTTALVWGLAVAGIVRGLWRAEASPSHAILLVAPAALAILQPYGGEMLMRVYLFSLPFASCYVARALLPAPRASGWLTSLALAAAAAVLVVGFLFTRYGNERTALFTVKEVGAVDRLYAIAPHGSVLVAASPNVPWKQRHYADYHYQLLSRQLVVAGPPPTARRLAGLVADYMRRDPAHRAFLLITRSQKIYDAVLGAQKWGSAAELERAVERSRLFRKRFDDGDGKIFVLRRRAR